LTEAASNNPANPALLQAQGTLISQTIFGDPDIRMACIRALGQMENRAALPALRDTLEDEDTIVRMESIRALASVATSTLDADSEGHMVTHSITNNEILEEISQALTDPQPSVRKYAADAVTTLLQHGSTDPEKRPAMIQKILDAGFAGAGEQARHMGQALRLLDSEVSSEHLIPLLESMESSAERRFVIEMLEEIYQPNENLQAPEQRLLSRHAA
jgi:HEAT repeat protein